MLWQLIESLNLQEEADADIAVALSPLLVRDMRDADVREFLRARRLWLTNPATGQRSMGVIGTAIQGDEFPPALLEALAVLAAAIYEDDAPIAVASDPQVAAFVHSTLNGLIAVGVIDEETADAFREIGGGFRFPDGIEESAVSESRTAAATSIDVEAMVGRVTNTAAIAEELIRKEFADNGKCTATKAKSHLTAAWTKAGE